MCADDAMESGLFTDSKERDARQAEFPDDIDDDTSCENISNDVTLETISDNDTYCPICGSSQTWSIGTLGKIVYYRCAACGMDFSHTVK